MKRIMLILLSIGIFATFYLSAKTTNTTFEKTNPAYLKSDLFKTLIELTNSETFKIRTATEYDWNTLGQADNSGYEIVNQGNDFIVLYVWQMIGKGDTIRFQLLEKTNDYSIFAYNENGQTESPFTYHSGFSVFKRYKNGKWEFVKQNLMGETSNAGIMGIFVYKPETKTLYIYKKEYVNDEGFAGELSEKYEWSNSTSCFEKIELIELPNPILIKGGGYEAGPFCNLYYYSPIALEYYHDNQTGDKEEFEFIYIYELPNGEEVQVDNKIMADIINNSDTKSRIFVKYKKEKILECNENNEKYEIEVNVIEDYEVVSKSPVIATFTDYSLGDFEWYEFTSPLGYLYYFNDFSDYKYSLIDEHGDGPNPKYKGKKFKIYFSTKTVENDFGGGEFTMRIVDKIELLDN